MQGIQPMTAKQLEQTPAGSCAMFRQIEHLKLSHMSFWAFSFDVALFVGCWVSFGATLLSAPWDADASPTPDPTSCLRWSSKMYLELFSYFSMNAHIYNHERFLPFVLATILGTWRWKCRSRAWRWVCVWSRLVWQWEANWLRNSSRVGHVTCFWNGCLNFSVDNITFWEIFHEKVPVIIGQDYLSFGLRT